MHMTSLHRELEKLPCDLVFQLSDWNWCLTGQQLTVCRDGTMYFGPEPLWREHIVSLDVEAFQPRLDTHFDPPGSRSYIPVLKPRGRIEVTSQSEFELAPRTRYLHFYGSFFPEAVPA